jgi:hypothetical protein
MSRLVWAAVLAAQWALAQNAPAVLPCDNKSVNKVDAYRVVTVQLLYVNCDTELTRFDTTATLNGATATVHLNTARDSWLRIEFSKPVLEGGQDYQLVLAPDGQAIVAKPVGTVQGPFEPLKILISTKAEAVIQTGLVNDFGVKFEIYSLIAFLSFPPDGPTFNEVILGNVRVQHLATTVPLKDSIVTECQANASCPPPQTTQPQVYGRAEVTLTLDHLYQPKATLQVTGLTDIFKQLLKIQSDVTLGAVPKTKDDSQWYLKLDHQAGPGSKPGVAIEAKIAPTLGRPLLGGFFFQPALNMDIGSGSVSSVKVNDTIIPSLGLTRLWRSNERGLEAIRITPALSFETNREFTKRNVVYDQDVQFFFSRLSKTRLQNSWVKYMTMQKDPKTKDVKFRSDLADWGAGVQVFLGGEFGHAIDDVTVKASKSSASVVIPTFPVARIRPKLSAFFEYKRITFTATAIPRFLATTEYTTRESSDGKSIRLIPVSGWRPYGEAGVTIGLDTSGHIALNTTYKLGSQPPTFVYANAVQSGLLLKY